MSSLPKYVEIMDTTLRDGEQTPGISYTPTEKQQIARVLLGEVGVDRIEVASARVITDRETGRNKGFGFVEMPDDSQARAAIEGLDGKELDGRTIKVNESKPKENSGGGGGGRGPRW